MKIKYIQVVTTISGKEDANKLACHLVEQRLAGCVQVYGPINSFYHWQGKLENDHEYQLQIKSRIDLYEILIMRHVKTRAFFIVY